jgi:cation diffusion facilitator CzcD-associated flavoprotein CzcO
VKITIIGAGLAGIGVAIVLKQAGHRVTILERAQDIGGVWRDNTYPGAACDIPTPLYSYSFEPAYVWTEAYAPQPEILGYIRHCAEKYGIDADVRFGKDAVRARFDAKRRKWTVECADGSCTESDVLVPAIGIFNTPLTPRLPGLGTFRGDAFHSAQWPRGLSVEGRRFAVVGSGASAVQIVPELAMSARRVHVLQRTPPYVMPRRAVDMEDMPSERKRIFRDFDEAAERRKSPATVESSRQAFLEHLARNVADPTLREALTPDYLFGCKRTLFSDEWYPALQRPHVNPVFERIERVTPAGLALTDGREIEVDAIVFATGFDPASYLAGIEVEGPWTTLARAWEEGARAHLGIAVAGFPNLFLMYGPNTNVAGSVVHMHECQARYILQCLDAMQEEGALSMEVRSEVMAASCEAIQVRLRASVVDASYCRSYMMDANGRVVTHYPGSQSDYERETMKLDAAEYSFT